MFLSLYDASTNLPPPLPPALLNSHPTPLPIILGCYRLSRSFSISSLPCRVPARVCSTGGQRHLRTPSASPRREPPAWLPSSSPPELALEEDLDRRSSDPHHRAALEIPPLARIIGDAYINLGNLTVHGVPPPSTQRESTRSSLLPVRPHLLTPIVEPNTESQRSTSPILSTLLPLLLPPGFDSSLPPSVVFFNALQNILATATSPQSARHF